MTDILIDRTINPMANYPYKPLTAEQLNAIRPFEHLKYNADIVEAIVKNCEMFGDKVSEEEKSNIGSYVYLAKQQFREEEKNAQLEQFAIDGYQPLTESIAKRLVGKRIELVSKYTLDWFTGKIEGTYKVLLDDDKVFLMKPRAKRRGILLHRLENPVYKLI